MLQLNKKELKYEHDMLSNILKQFMINQAIVKLKHLVC